MDIMTYKIKENEIKKNNVENYISLTCFSPSLMTPLSIISLYKSLPSRVRSPTPAKTEKPPDHKTGGI
nr:renalase [Candidatus Liberibacter sp.]